MLEKNTTNTTTQQFIAAKIAGVTTGE